jgi:membrane protease YdiL (CAAX protease family)
MKQLKFLHAFIGFAAVFSAYIILSIIIISCIPKSPVSQYLIVGLLEIFIFPVPVILYCRFRGFGVKETFGLKIPGTATFFIALLAILSGIFIILNINSLLSPLFHGYEDSLEKMEQDILSLGRYNIFAMFLIIAVVPAISEEFLFRGFMMRGFINSYGKIKAVILTSLLFGIMHLLLPKIVITSLIGVLFGVIFVLTDSLVVPIIGHFINNTLVLLSLMHKNAAGQEDNIGSINIPFLLIAVVIFIGCIYWLAKRTSNELTIKREGGIGLL